MAIQPVNTSTENTNSRHKHFREATTPVKTDNLKKPLKPEGHLVNDNPVQAVKYFFKDISYDIKAVKDGFQGKANDHQQGRVNDVGIRLAGIGIATYLASKTADPKARVMEYVGLGAFLAAMSLYPKIAVNAPSRIYQGFDIGKEYIDDQGRKKSVMQDSNYIPFDMYQGDYKGEDLDEIGDKMGIPRDIKNRHDLIKEQMRKISIQNNTLWMWTAGIGTPVMAALASAGIAELLVPAMQKTRNGYYNNKISETLKHINDMSLNAADIKENSLSKEVSKILGRYKDKELPKEEYENIITLITDKMSANTTAGVKEDLKNIFLNAKKGETSFVIDDTSAQRIIDMLQTKMPRTEDKAIMEKVFIPAEEELCAILQKYGSKEITKDELESVKGDIKELFSQKIEQFGGDKKAFLKAKQNVFLEDISQSIQVNKSNFVTEEVMKEVVDFAKIMGEFKTNAEKLDKCKIFKFEHAPQTVLANSFAKFEDTLFDVLDIKFKDMKLMQQDEKYAKEILEKKIEALVKDDTKYQKAIEKLSKVMSEMEIALHGNSDTESYIKDLFTAVENNFDNTARRLDRVSSSKFQNTIDRLIKDQIDEKLVNSAKTREDIFHLLDGTNPNKTKELGGLEYALANARGQGSSKYHVTSRMIDRYQGVQNSFARMLHTLDFYKREVPQGEYAEQINKMGKDILLNATSAQTTLKYNTVNNPDFYKDIMNTVWRVDEHGEGTLVKGFVTDLTKKGMEKENSVATGNILDRFQQYIYRFRNIMGNNKIDFTKPDHVLNEGILNEYSKGAKTRLAMFNLVAKSPTELVKDAASRKYANRLWVKRAGIIGGSVLGLAWLAQLGFGKIKNPQNMQKVGDNGTNS